jgi:flagellar L-ring protein precursor FlgH
MFLRTGKRAIEAVKLCCLPVMVAALLTAGCTTVPPTNVHQPMTATPAPRPIPQATNGAIYHAENQRLVLFEDIRARNIGDTLTIVIEEKTTGSKKSASTASRTGSVDATVPDVFGVGALRGLNVKSDASNTFSGKGDSASNNVLTGTITVTVIEVLANGNLLVSGEKQVAIDQGTEYVRFSGVVNPSTISGANTVSSTKVADARVEYKGSGYIDEAQTMGWLARFFLTVLPF